MRRHHADTMESLLGTICSVIGHRWTPWERPLRLVETCRCNRCGQTRTRRLGLT
jgi:hypothetical protein